MQGKCVYFFFRTLSKHASFHPLIFRFLLFYLLFPPLSLPLNEKQESYFLFCTRSLLLPLVVYINYTSLFSV
ncbi:hypothetical protein BY458DRAFT_530044 [Sporodiniella umbellata]|nr:hypothetical protein BY458DRAFT_530044 [Sporodiniella umbellata]